MDYTIRHPRALALATCLVIATSAHGDSPKTADDALTFMSTKMSEYKDWSGEFTQTMGMGGMSLQTKGTMSMRPPKEMRMVMSIDMFGQPMKTLIVSGKDGFVWTEIDVMGQKQVMKMDLSKMNPDTAKQFGGNGNPLDKANPTAQVKEYQKAYDFTVKGDGEHDGQPVTELEGAKRKDAAALELDPQVAAVIGAATKVRLLIGRKDGFLYKTEMLDASGTALLTHAFTNVKFNQGTTDSDFQYAPPEGVSVTDITPMIQSPAKKPEPSSTPAQPATPAK